jgi:hypothetical protein
MLVVAAAMDDDGGFGRLRALHELPLNSKFQTWPRRDIQ